MSKNVARYKKVAQLRKAGKTFQQIGEVIGTSRQRAQEIYSRIVKAAKTRTAAA